jgi:hypothetical protein
MVERYRSYEPDLDRLEQDITGSLNNKVRPYAFGRTATGYQQEDSVPLFLSDPEGEPDPTEFDYAGHFQEPRRFSIPTKILMATIAASTMAIAFAWFSSDATRDALESAKVSMANVLPVPSAAAQPDGTTQLTAQDVQLKDPGKLPAVAEQAPALAPAPQQQVAMLPSRDDISTAYQNALQNRAPAAASAPVAPATVAPATAALAPAAPPPAASAPLAAVAPVAVAPQVRRMDPDELTNLMQRAKRFVAAGDLPAARLLLERAADAQEAEAALMLAQTYDPDVVGAQDVRNIIAEPAKARAWYQKAAQLGSTDAQRRLAQLAN